MGRKSVALELEAASCQFCDVTGTEQLARVRISLKGIEPEIWRRVDVPLGMSLKGLHDVIQAVMGWRDYHLFEFQIGQKLYGLPDPPDDYGRKVLHAKLAKLEAVIAKGHPEV